MTEPKATNGTEPPTTADDPTHSAKPFASSHPPRGTPPRTLAQWIDFFAHCEHPANGVVPGVLVEENDKRLPFTWCGTCGAMHLLVGTDPGWIPPGLATVFLDDTVFVDFRRDVAFLARALAELLTSGRALSEALKSAPNENQELREAIGFFALTCLEVEQRAQLVRGSLEP
jgi:hypothetical protein